jgi:hypothetical protein
LTITNCSERENASSNGQNFEGENGALGIAQFTRIRV